MKRGLKIEVTNFPGGGLKWCCHGACCEDLAELAVCDSVVPGLIDGVMPGSQAPAILCLPG